VIGRLIDNITGNPAAVAEDEVISVGVAAASGPSSLPTIQKMHVTRTSTFELWLPVGKKFVSLSGGPLLWLGDVSHGIGHDSREIDVKSGQENTIDFRVVRIIPMANRAAESGEPFQPRP